MSISAAGNAAIDAASTLLRSSHTEIATASRMLDDDVGSALAHVASARAQAGASASVFNATDGYEHSGRAIQAVADRLSAATTRVADHGPGSDASFSSLLRGDLQVTDRLAVRAQVVVEVDTRWLLRTSTDIPARIAGLRESGSAVPAQQADAIDGAMIRAVPALDAVAFHKGRRGQRVPPVAMSQAIGAVEELRAELAVRMELARGDELYAQIEQPVQGVYNALHGTVVNLQIAAAGGHTNPISAARQMTEAIRAARGVMQFERQVHEAARSRPQRMGTAFDELRRAAAAAPPA